jgi:short subunit dehydrogenase-like uncharacterized protein
MTRASDKTSREFDLVVFGASGFTGRLVVEYLRERYATGGELRWAVAGRNPEKLDAVLEGLGIAAGEITVLVADSRDADALDEVAKRCRVVLTTVGPYAKHGSELVAACVRNGTSYCDLAGEVQWMRQMIDRHQQAAEASGARIVHACGFDSIPSDLGVWRLQREAVERFGKTCNQVSLLVRAMRGGFSGGTAASLLNVIEESRRDRAVARQLVDPYTLNPEGMREGPDGRDQAGVGYNEALGVWTAPFVMAVINQRVVRRTNALLDYEYGKDFRYNEAVITGPGTVGRLKAVAATAAMGAFMLASSIDFTRRNIVRRLLPAQGSGPGESDRESGFFNLVLVGSTHAGETLRLRVTGDRDPGYGSTSRMIAESAVCLARDTLDVGGGFWTPASAMDGKLLTRLEQNAGLAFEFL